MVCNSGVGLTPLVDGKLHDFSIGGVYNGVVLLIDDQTRSYWDHITGEAVHGPLTGARLEMWGIEMTTVGAALAADADLRLYVSRMRWTARLVTWLIRRFAGRLPPGFRATMGAPDTRLPEMALGLGVVTDGSQRFFPLADLAGDVEVLLDGRRLRVSPGSGSDAVPAATWVDDGSRPVQLFTRWYAFAYTFPDCSLDQPA